MVKRYQDIKEKKFCYRLPTKFREGNVFSHVCLSVCLLTVGVEVLM